MTRVLHLSADYPDAIVPGKTRAIAALVEGTDSVDHCVYSLNRTGGLRAWTRPGALTVVADDGRVRSCRYAAPPFGAMLGRAMRRLADEIGDDLARRRERVDLIHAHKLSVEGLAARHLARRLDVPFMLTIQGNSDRKILSARRELTRQWRDVWCDAREVIAFAPWAADWVGSRLGERSPPPVALPCITASESIIAPAQCPPVVRTAFHLDGWRNKNIAGLAKAVALARPLVPGLRLEVAGGGSPGSRRAVEQVLRDAGIADIGACVGPLPASDLQRWMNGAAVFALVSRRESFGMVFLEALMAGCPVIYPAGAAIEGYFPGRPFARAAPADDPNAIAGAIAATIGEQAAVKAALKAFQDEGGFGPFQGKAILATYKRLVRSALA